MKESLLLFIVTLRFHVLRILGRTNSVFQFTAERSLRKLRTKTGPLQASNQKTIRAILSLHRIPPQALDYVDTTSSMLDERATESSFSLIKLGCCGSMVHYRCGIFAVENSCLDSNFAQLLLVQDRKYNYEGETMRRNVAETQFLATLWQLLVAHSSMMNVFLMWDFGQALDTPTQGSINPWTNNR